MIIYQHLIKEVSSGKFERVQNMKDSKPVIIALRSPENKEIELLRVCPDEGSMVTADIHQIVTHRSELQIIINKPLVNLVGAVANGDFLYVKAEDSACLRYYEDPRALRLPLDALKVGKVLEPGVINVRGRSNAILFHDVGLSKVPQYIRGYSVTGELGDNK